MAGLRKQNQTAHGLPFLLVLSSDHTTPATGLSPTVTLSKNGGAFASCAGAVTEIAHGWYKVAGNAADAGTLGPLLLHATAATADPTDSEFQVVAFDPDDAARLGLTSMPNAVPGGAGGLPTVDANNAVYALQNFDFTVDTNPNAAETTILNALDDLHVTVADIDPDALAAIATAATGGGGGGSWAGDGDTLVNHDTGGTDNLRVMSGGQPVDNAFIRAYLTDEYNAGATTAQVRGNAVTNVLGRWVNPMFIDGGFNYTFIAEAPGRMNAQALTADV